MLPQLSTHRMRYYQPLALVCEDLHTSATAQPTAVRQGRRTDLPLLRAGLPNFFIPAVL